MKPEDLLIGLDEDQRSAVASESETLCVLAGAGSGKTRVLTRRVGYRIATGAAESGHALVLTFTRKAAGELQKRLVHLGVESNVTAGTFHAIAYAQLRRRWLDLGRPVPIVAGQPTRIVEAVLQAMRLGRSVQARLVVSEISWAKSYGLMPDDYEEGVHRFQHRPPIAAPQMARIYEAYESEKRKRRIIDYDDLLLLMAQALEQDRTFAAGQRWLFRHFFVDEFQDVNRAQFTLLRLWLGDRRDVFVVGDPNQAIYGWNGADASYLLNIDRYVPGIETIRLHTNYRSNAHVLAAAQAILPTAAPRLPEEELDDVASIGVAPRVVGCDDEQAEATYIARELRSAHGRGLRWADMAILVRTNAQRSSIEKTLETFSIPYQAAGGAGWLYQQDVRAAFEFLREVPRHPLARHMADLEEISEGPGVAELMAAARECLQGDPTILIADFLSWVEVASRHDGPSSSDRDTQRVTVTTFHRAKGLEWQLVIVAGTEDGLVPMGNVSGAQLEEEQRLFYVAVTRARSELLCTWAQSRINKKGDAAIRKPSPWLSSIEQSVAPELPSPRRLVREVIDEGRAVLHLEDDANDARTALLKWRAARAKLTGVAGHLILSDDLVEAIAASKPETTADLVACGLGAVRAASIGDQLLAAVSSPLRTG